jgi:hypothetical protein
MLLGSLFLLPFTALPYFSDILREVSTEGAFYLLLPTILLTFFFLPLNVKKVFVDRAIIKVCSIYLLYIFIIFLINYGVISSSVHMDKAGVSRFIFQYIELGFGFIIIFTNCLTAHFYTNIPFPADALLKLSNVTNGVS